MIKSSMRAFSRLHQKCEGHFPEQVGGAESAPPAAFDAQMLAVLDQTGTIQPVNMNNAQDPFECVHHGHLGAADGAADLLKVFKVEVYQSADGLQPASRLLSWFASDVNQVLDVAYPLMGLCLETKRIGYIFSLSPDLGTPVALPGLEDCSHVVHSLESMQKTCT